MTFRRRQAPYRWTNEQLAAQIRAVFRSRIDDVADVGGEVHPAGVVFHQDAALLPHKMVRAAKHEQGGFVPYAFYGVQWNDYLETCVAMGDEPVDTFRTYSGHESESAARSAAKQWLADEGDQPIEDLAFGALPPFAQSMVGYVLRRGPYYF